jgi:hypothetical protein
MKRVILLMTIFLFSSGAWAKDDGLKPEDLLVQIEALEAVVAQLQTDFTNHIDDDASHHSKYTDSEAVAAADPDDILGVFSRGGNDIFMDGANLHVRNGDGSTDATPNGTGNLIIGYNEERSAADVTAYGPDERTGSHMLITGSGNNYSEYGGIVSGDFNSAGAPLSSILGGRGNTTMSVLDFAAVLTENMTVIGGEDNLSTGRRAIVIGGENNVTTGKAPDAVIVSGFANTADFGNSFIGGGRLNMTKAFGSSIHGGRENVIGDGTTAFAQWASIHGGRNNTSMGFYSTIVGGRNNSATGDYSSVNGGRYNTTEGNFSSINGGFGPNTTISFGENPDTHTP